MNAHERMPNYVSTAFGKISPEQYIDMICRIIGFYHQNNRLPNFATIGRTVNAAPTTESGKVLEVLDYLYLANCSPIYRPPVTVK